MKNLLSIDIVKEFDVVYIETTKKELFEISFKNNQFNIKHNDKDYIVSDFKSAQFLNGNSTTIMLGKEKTMKMPDYFIDGILKGWNLSFTIEEGTFEQFTSKGKIEKCFSKQIYDNGTLNIHLFEPVGRRINPFDKLGSKGFEVITDQVPVKFDFIDGRLLYSGKCVVVLGSLFNIKKPKDLKEIIKQKNYTLDVNFQFIMANKPFMILTESGNGEGYNLNIIYSRVLDIRTID